MVAAPWQITQYQASLLVIQPSSYPENTEEAFLHNKLLFAN
jgi:hypothetical protein